MEKKDILTSERKQIITLLAAEQRFSDFYLSGGTALAAFYLQHRFSEDLDFFSFYQIDYFFTQNFMEQVRRHLGAKSMRYEHLFDRNLFFLELPNSHELKIEFTKYPFAPLGKMVKHNGIWIDSLRDIAANKLMTVIDRFDPKDFVDLFFLLKHFTLNKIRRDVQKKFGITIGDMLLGSELAKVRRVEALPKMLKTLGISELKEFFAGEARKIGSRLIEKD